MTAKRKPHLIAQNQQSEPEELKEEWPEDPMNLFRKWFEDAKKIKEHEPEAMALATAADGRPSLRMVLFRDIKKTGFCFFTNYDSRKAWQLELNPFSSLLFYWPKLYRQVRVEGKVKRRLRKFLMIILTHVPWEAASALASRLRVLLFPTGFSWKLCTRP